MKQISIFNHVLGPVMRGPSSSHTAGAYHLGRMARSLLRAPPRRAVLAFDPEGSYAATYAEQGADRSFAMGLMEKPLTDDSFFTSLDDAASAGLEIEFQIRPLAEAEHPNTVELRLTGTERETLELVGRCVGGGEVELVRLNGRPIRFNGSAYEVLLEVPVDKAAAAAELLNADGAVLQSAVRSDRAELSQLTAGRRSALPAAIRDQLRGLDDNARFWESDPVYFVQTGPALFSSAAEMLDQAAENRCTLGQLALAHESQLLNVSEADVVAEMLRRYDIMAEAVEQGLALNVRGLQLLPACAGQVFTAEAEDRLSARSVNTRAAARALAVMHVDGAMGVVCAAPTGGSAGVIPGTLVTLAEERSLTRRQIAEALLAAGSIGVIVALRATFAAEVAGCQVEIGASGAMAAAAVVDAVGGTAGQACDAAAISFQNTMGSVCDLVQGMVEIPCHTRNAAAAANAFVNADLVLGGYTNYIPLDETIDAVYAVGVALPPELRCTSKGGLAVTPSARALPVASSNSESDDRPAP